MKLATLTASWLRRQPRFAPSSARPRPAQHTAAGRVETVYFESRGTRLEAWLFQPPKPTTSVVIMAHGLAGTKECLLEPYAWRFVRDGFAVLLFDFRTLGGSEGYPRHWVDPFRQIEDYEAALDYARRRFRHAVLWGTSFSGGQVLCVAARRPTHVAAVIANAPFLGLARHLRPKGWMLVRFAVMAALDSALAAFSAGRLPSIYIPAFGKPGEYAFARSVECPSRWQADWSQAGAFWAALPTELRGGWHNALCARLGLRVLRFAPKKILDRVRCPVLLIGAKHDTLIPEELLSSAAQRLPNARLAWLDCQHFELYVPPCLEQSLELQSSFVRQLNATSTHTG